MKKNLFYWRLLLSALIFLLITQASSGRSQNLGSVTIDKNSITLSDVFKSIKKQTGLTVFYSNRILNDNERVSLNFQNADLKEVLNYVLKDKNLAYVVQGQLIVIEKQKVTAVQKESVEVAAPKKIQGTVTDEKGLPLPGVSIRIKGVNTGTQTDINGKFSLTADDDKATLVFSFIGYNQEEIRANGRDVIDLQLKPAPSNLNEVVVVGYGTQKKVTVTGSISTVKGDDLKTAPTPSLSNTLAGRTTGLIVSSNSGEPGYDDASILIRGRATTQNTSPLIVVDGIADRAGGFSRIDANDVETITVLKDASASIYGMRAANGVILVTTKRGKLGKPQVDYTFNYGLRQPTRLPKMIDAATYAQAYNEMEQNIYNRPARYTAEDIQKFKDGSDPLGHPNTNWYDAVLQKTAPQYQTNLSVRGGTEAVKYFISVGNQYQDGYYKNSATSFRQYNVRSNLDAQVTKSFKVTLNMAVRQENRKFPHWPSSRIFNDIINAVPTYNPVWADTGLPNLPIGDDRNPVFAVTDKAGYEHDTRTYYNGDLGINWSLPVPGLSVIANLSVDKDNTFDKQWFHQFQLYTKNNLTDKGEVPRTYGPANNATLYENMNVDLGVTANARLNYTRQFKGGHNVSAFVAYEQYTFRNDYLAANRTSFISTQVDELFAGNTDNTNVFGNDGSAKESSRQSYFGRFDYDFNGKYIFQFNFRYDGSDAFPPSNRYGFFPAFSAGWRVSEEKFFKDAVPFVNNLKIRGSWGERGNDLVDPFQFLSTYSLGAATGQSGIPAPVFGGANPTEQTGAYAGVSPNVNSHWEVDKTTNLGFEASMLNNSINLTVDVFHQVRSNILAKRAASVPLFTGLQLPNENIGKVQNNGLEVTLGYNKTINDFHFNVAGNITITKSKILFIDEAVNIPAWQRYTGHQVGSDYLLYNAIGVFKSQAQIDATPHEPNTKPGDLIFQDYDKNGVIDANDRVLQNASRIPSLQYGLTFDASYKNFSLSMVWAGQGGNAKAYVYFSSGEVGNFTQEYWDNHWTPDKPNATGPRLYDRETIPSTAYQNTYFLRSTNYIRLKTLQLGYTFNKQTVRGLPFNSLMLYVSGFNLLTFDGLKVIDPENAANNGPTGWVTPQTRVFNFGVNVNF